MIASNLAGSRIFYLEDDFYLAEDGRERLTDAGAEVVICGSVPRAFEVIANIAFDFALLDVDICGQSSVPVARHFKDAGLPFIFLTASEPSELPLDLASSPHWRKPADWMGVMTMISNLLG